MDTRMYFASEAISSKREMTSEGYMICYDVPIARTGTMLYGDYEHPTLEARNGIITVERDDAEVFRLEAMASFEGKPVTNDHPDEFVSAANWRSLAVGVVQSVRRGEGLDSDVLLADLLIMDGDAIEAINKGKREVSCGYDCTYEQIEPGRARQVTITGNHVALVERGRCGSRCSIQDKNGVSHMSKTATFKEKLLAAITLGDKTAISKTLDELPDLESKDANGTHIHVHNAPQLESKPTEDKKALTLDERMTRLEAAIADLAKKGKTNDSEEEEETNDSEGEETEDEDEEEKGKTSDAASAHADLIASAAILAPDFEVPSMTTDAMKDRKKAKDAICKCQRRILDAAMSTKDGKAAVTPFLVGYEVSKLTNDAVAYAFKGATELARHMNNAKLTVSTQDKKVATHDAFKPGGIDKINQDFWKQSKA